jgi:hypothetical protein
MAREFAPIKLAIWSDDSFRALSEPAQHLYFKLCTSPSLSHCGVADWRPSRIAALTRGQSADDVRAAGAELVANLYILVDEDTEEVLIRSYLRHDGLMKQPKMATAMATAHAAVASSVLRGVIVHELIRLRQDFPELNGWKSDKAAALLSKGSVDPSTYPLGKGSIKGIGNPNSNPSGEGSVKGSPTPAPAPAPSSINLHPDDSRCESEQAALIAVQEPPKKHRKKPATRIPDDWKPIERHVTFARERGVDLPAEVFKFRNHAIANDRTQADWDASFSNWLANAKSANRFEPTPLRELRRDPGTNRAVDW